MQKVSRQQKWWEGALQGQRSRSPAGLGISLNLDPFLRRPTPTRPLPRRPVRVGPQSEERDGPVDEAPRSPAPSSVSENPSAEVKGGQQTSPRARIHPRRRRSGSGTRRPDECLAERSRAASSTCGGPSRLASLNAPEKKSEAFV